MQAIKTKFIPATDTKPRRIKAFCERGSITLPEPGNCVDDIHVWAATRLLRRFVLEDKKRYGIAEVSNPWSRKRVSGSLPSGHKAHVFIS